MTELELQLREFAPRLDWPSTPQLAASVRQRLEGAPRRRAGLTRRRFVLAAVAVLAVAVGGTLAVPPARTAILDWLGIRGVEITRVEKLPALRPVEDDLYVGDPATLAQARSRSGHEVVLPRAEGVGGPDGIYVDETLPGRPVSLVWGSVDEPRLLVVQFDAKPLIEKLATLETDIERVVVDGEPGLWLSGAPHEFFYNDAKGETIRDTQRLAGNVLVWERGPLTVRLEGDVSKSEALRIARSFR